MGLGTVTWACLLLATHAGSPPPGGGAALPADVWPMNQRGFRIPIRINAARQAEIKELLLYVSRDEGKQWGVVGKALPSQTYFPYYAEADGVYWFTVAVVDRKDRQDPPNVMLAPVGQKILVDTTRPDLRLTADRQGDEVVARWTVQEDHPDWTTLKLEYRPAGGPDDHWVSVGILPDQNQTAFNPGVPGAVLVRVQLKDRAGNLGQSAPVEVAAAAPARPAATALAHRVDDTPGWPPRSPQDLAPPPGVGWSGAQQASAASAQPVRPYEGGGLPLAGRRGDIGATAPAAPPDPPPPPPAPSGPPAGYQAAPPAAPRGVLPQLRLVNRPDVNLEFQVSKFGPSGPGNVDVFVTLDEGANWEQYRLDMPPNWPLAAFEMRGQAPVRGSVTVQLKDEGVIYGFYLVVKSKAGLGKPPPQRGEPPQIRVELDHTAAKAELYKPKADPGSHEILILEWGATDRNLAPNPVTLEYADNRDGPWHTIGEQELPNTTPTTGHFAWHVSESVPSRVYLKLTVRDAAGNVAVAQTREPILVDLAVPDVVVTGASASYPR